jgi:hypothetical protein
MYVPFDSYDDEDEEEDEKIEDKKERVMMAEGTV